MIPWDINGIFMGYTLWLCQQFANLKIAIEIVDLPSYKMVIFHSYVSLPEGMFSPCFFGFFGNDKKSD